MYNDNPSFDLNLKKAIHRIEKEELEDLYKAVEENPHVFSKKFERKMNWTISNSSKSYFSMINTVAKRVAIVAVTVFSVLTITTFSVEALREPVVKFFTQVFHEFTSIVFQVDEETEPLPKTIEINHFPEYVPKGYEVGDQSTMEGFIRIIYINETEYDILFEQSTIEATDMALDTEDVTMETLLIGDYEAKYFSNKGFQHLIWTDGNYSYSLQGPVSKEELILMAESTK